MEDSRFLIDLYFDNIENIDGGLPAHNLVTVLKWTTNKFPESKKLLNRQIFERMMSFRSEVIQCLSLADYFIREKDCLFILTNEQYFEIYKKYYVETTDTKHFRLYLDSYYNYLEHVKKNDKKRYKGFLKKYCDFAIKNIDLFDNYTALSVLSSVRKYMDEAKCYEDRDYQIVDTKIESFVKASMKEMQDIKIDMPEELNEQFRKEIQEQNSAFNALKNNEKIDKLLLECDPISLDDLKQEYEKSKHSIFDTNDGVIDEDGKFINCSDLSEQDKFILKAHTSIKIHVALSYNLLIYPFFNSFVMDEESLGHIKKVLTNNKFIPNDKIDLMTEIISNFFKKNYEHSVYNLCEELESCIRYYFKSKGMNVYKKDGSGDVIGLNNVFNNFENNSYRDRLLETIDEDFYFTLKWFLTDNYGFGLRNKVAHRYSSKDLYKHTYSIFAAIQIIRLIWGFQNDSMQ